MEYPRGVNSIPLTTCRSQQKKKKKNTVLRIPLTPKFFLVLRLSPPLPLNRFTIRDHHHHRLHIPLCSSLLREGEEEAEEGINQSLCVHRVLVRTGMETHPLLLPLLLLIEVARSPNPFHVRVMTPLSPPPPPPPPPVRGKEKCFRRWGKGKTLGLP